MLMTGSMKAQFFFNDSLLYSNDTSIPSFMLLSEQQKEVFPAKTLKSDKMIQAKTILKEVVLCDNNNMSAEMQDTITDINGNTSISFSQYYKGLKVENTRSIVHYKGNMADHVNGNFRSIDNLAVNPQILENEALNKALNHINAEEYMWENEQNNQWLREEQEDTLATFFPKGELMIYFNSEDIPVLVYRFDIYAAKPLSRNYVYVNAINGKVEGTANRINFVSGTAATRYSGSRTIETQYNYNNSNVYRLHDISRGQGIRTYNLRGQSSYVNIDYTDSNNDGLRRNGIIPIKTMPL
jgi:Zn-dependent metalloprotease